MAFSRTVVWAASRQPTYYSLTKSINRPSEPSGGAMATLHERTQGAKPTRTLKVGIAGLGIGSAMVIPTIERMPETELVAAADVRREALEGFVRRYDVPAYDS